MISLHLAITTLKPRSTKNWTALVMRMIKLFQIMRTMAKVHLKTQMTIMTMTDKMMTLVVAIIENNQLLQMIHFRHRCEFVSRLVVLFAMQLNLINFKNRAIV